MPGKTKVATALFVVSLFVLGILVYAAALFAFGKIADESYTEGRRAGIYEVQIEAVVQGFGYIKPDASGAPQFRWPRNRRTLNER